MNIPALKTIVAHKPHLLWDEKGNPCIKHIAKELQSELEKRLKGLRVSISDIEGLKSRFVLLIGSDDYLLDAVAAYIYCLRSVDGCTGLYYQSFRGKPDDWVASELTTQSDFFNDTTIRQYKAIVSKEGSGTQFSVCASTGYPKTMNGDLLDHIEQGRSVFLGDLKYQNSLLLEGLGKKIASIKTHWEMYQTDKRGLLIVSTLSKKDLPVYFAKQFEVIDFNPKQAQPTEQVRPKVSFNDVDLIVTINGKEYLFEETTKEHRKNKLKEAYKLFEFLYKNQHRRIKKGEIGKGLEFDNNEQRVFNAVSKAKKVIKCSPYSISTEKEYDDRGGYLLVVKKIDLESS